MNFVGVLSDDDDVMGKINFFKSINKPIDGHAPGLTGTDLDKYILAGIKTDHECETPEELREKIEKGMYVMIREGSAARNFDHLIGGVDSGNLNRVLFCTDDRHPQDIINEGHIDNHVRKALKNGMPLEDAVQIATINAANCYGLKNIGAIAPGYQADLLILKDDGGFQVSQVYKKGILITENCFDNKNQGLESKLVLTMRNSMRMKAFDLQALRIETQGAVVNTIGILGGSLITPLVKLPSDAIAKKELLKLVVVERHHATGNMAKCYVSGLKMYDGAIAMTIAHDSHNIIAIGSDDENIYAAIQSVEKSGGGIALAHEGQILEVLPLKVAGLMSELTAMAVADKLSSMMKLVHESLKMDSDIDPFLMLAFLALPVIPEVKLTDQGLFDVIRNEFIPLFEE